MNLPPLLELRELPEDARGLILEQLVQEASPDLCGRLFERCLLLLGSGNCGADHPIWKQACEKFGLRRMVRADWRATFGALCRELQRLRDEGKSRYRPRRCLGTFFDYVQGRAEEVDVEREESAIDYLEGHPLVREAFLGLGAVEKGTRKSWANLKNALESGDVDAVKAAIGTGLNAGVRFLFDLTDMYRPGEEETNLEWVRLLLEAGVRTDAMYVGDTLLLRPVKDYHRYSESTQVVKLLLEYDVDPNDGGVKDPPLHELVKYANLFFDDGVPNRALMERTQLLLDYGADPTLSDESGGTALSEAEKWRNKRWIPDQRAFWDSYIDLLEEYASYINVHKEYALWVKGSIGSD